jgi:hypothetical protein
MIVLSHRGYWLEPAERNQRVAFERSFRLGFGTETDLRDANGKIVISHDVPVGEVQNFSEFLTHYRAHAVGNLPLALNIKADGLAAIVKQDLAEFPELDVFAFDMAVPDMRAYIECGIPVFTRMSEVEQQPSWLEQSAGIWLDSFGPTWFEAGLVADLLATGKRVCVVSSELHRREPEPLWEMLTEYSSADNLLLCTDMPVQAQAFFKI